MLEHDFVDICEDLAMSGFRLVTLDVTNTLLKVSGGPGPQYAAVAAMYGVHAKASDITTSFRYQYRHYTERYPNFGTSSGITPYKWWTDLVKDCFKSAAAANIHSQILPTTNQNEILTQIANHLYLHFSTAKAWEIMPGTELLLSSLKANNIKVGAVSNFDERLEKILSCLALRHYFDFVLPSVKVGCEKPNRQIFEQALKLAKVPASEAVHVGDSYEKDFLGAQDAGMSAYLVYDKTKSQKNVDPKYVVHTLTDLLKRLDVTPVSTDV